MAVGVRRLRESESTPTVTRHRAQWLTAHSLALTGLVLAGLVLRTYRLDEWWSIYNDYDEGAWAMTARLIAEGAVPYRDFLLVHPPFYEFVLAAVYRVTGFSFVGGRVVAAFFGTLTIPLAAWLAHRAFGPRAALWTAFAVAASPILVFAGRRVVPDAFAVCLAVGAIGLGLAFLRDGKAWRLTALGSLLALLALTKFTHVMTAAAVVTGLTGAVMPQSWWARVSAFARPRVLGTTALLAAGAYAVVYYLHYGRGWGHVKVPLLFDFFLKPLDLAVLAAVTALPAVFAWWWLRPGLDLPRLERVRVPWRAFGLIAGGGAATALVALAPVIATAPLAFLEHTILLQSNRPGVVAPSLLQFARYFTGFFQPLSLYQAEVLLVLPFAWLVARRVNATPAERFLAVGGLAAVAFAQPLGSFPRYYISVYPFLVFLVGIAFRDVKWGRPARDLKPAGAIAFSVFLLALTIPVPYTYWGYDIANALTDPSEDALNDASVDALAGMNAQKVYATSPTLPLLDPDIPTSRVFDTFGYLWLMGESPEGLVDRALEDGADVLVITPWAHLWGGDFGVTADALKANIRERAVLERIVGDDPVYHVEIYRVGGTARAVVANPTLANLTETTAGAAPVAWHPQLVENTGSHANVTRENAFTRFSLYQSGNKTEGDWVHAGVTQRVPFPEAPLTARVRTTAMTTESAATVIESGVQFKDDAGRTLVIGFGGGVKPVHYDRSDDAWGLTVFPVASGEWAEVTFDVRDQWRARGWPEPAELTMEVYAAAHAERPGTYVFDVAYMGPH